MSTPTKEEITAFLEKLQGRLAAVEKDREDLATAEKDIVALEERVRAIGEPDYRDDKSIRTVTELQLKANLCRKTIERLSQAPAISGLLEILPPGAELAAGVLREVVDNRRETVVRTILPFFLTRTGAEVVAAKTDACIGAERRINELLHTASFGQMTGHVATTMQLAGQVNAILSESVKRAPDLLQFIPFQSAEAIEATAQTLSDKTS